MSSSLNNLLKPVLVLLLYNVLFRIVISQDVPKVLIEILQPKGLRASIPNTPTTTLFAFHGNVNRKILNDDVGSISGEVLAPTNGRWVFEDHDVELKPDDVINYYVFIFIGGAGRLIDNLKYTVGDDNIPPPTTGNDSKDCVPSVTTIKGHNTKICPGEVIFEDNFNNEFNSDLWKIEQKLPFDYPEYPFVSYQRLSDSPTVKLEAGNLVIRPQLQQNMPGFTNESIFSGVLDLRDGCTERVQSCYMSANGANILPPIVSGRISSQEFAFMYGEVQIRAKLPQGDWLYPEILLEPLMHKYGISNFASGVIKIAAARGNTDLYLKRNHFNNKVLYGGPIMDFHCYDNFLQSQNNPSKNWGADFHTYTLRWEPDKLVFLVDETEWARLEPGRDGLRSEIPRTECPDASHTLWSSGDKMAPFDEFFYITLGVAAGGVLDFKDNTRTSGAHPKPWRNSSSKSKLNFWLDLDNWFRTWDQNSVLLIDWIKVIAL